MKKNIFALALCAMTMLGFDSCNRMDQPIEQEDGTRSVTFCASLSEQTKTGLAMKFVPNWKNTDIQNVHLYEFFQGEAIEGTDVQMTTPVNGTYELAHFRASFGQDMSIIVTPPTTKAAPETYTYAGVVASQKDHKFIIPDVQTPDSESLIDPAADFIVADGQVVYDDSKSENQVNLHFVRPVAASRLAIMNIEGQRIKTVKIVSSDKLTASAELDDIDFAAGTVDFDSSNGSETITLSYGSGVEIPAESTFYAYFISLPGSKKILSIEVTTDRYVYTKSMGAGKTLTFNTTDFKNIAVDMSKVTPTIPKESQTLSFSKTSVDYDIATGSFTAPALSGAKTAVTYASSNTAVADVNSSTGAVTIKGVGSATITATAAETANYTSATASYTINVTDSTPTESVSGYHLVTSEPSDWSGKYVIVSADKKYLWTGANTTPNTVTLSASDFDGNVIVKSGLSGYEFTISKNGSGYYLMKDGKYVYCNYSGDGNGTTGIGLSSSSHAISFNGSMNSGTVGFYMNYGDMDQYIYLKTSGGSSYFKFGGSHGGNGVYLYKYVSFDKTFTKVNSVTAGKNYVIVDTNAKMALKNDPSGSNSELYDQAYSVDGKVGGNTLTIPAADASAITWTAGTSNAHTTQGTLTFRNGSYYLARGNTTANGNNDTVLLSAVNAYSVWTFNGSNLSMKNSTAQYTFYLFYNTSENHWDTEQQSATNNIAIYEQN